MLSTMTGHLGNELGFSLRAFRAGVTIRGLQHRVLTAALKAFMIADAVDVGPAEGYPYRVRHTPTGPEPSVTKRRSYG
jgi:lambda repressor-like predicted transcriptional regulator